MKSHCLLCRRGHKTARLIKKCSIGFVFVDAAVVLSTIVSTQERVQAENLPLKTEAFVKTTIWVLFLEDKLFLRWETFTGVRPPTRLLTNTLDRLPWHVNMSKVALNTDSCAAGWLCKSIFIPAKRNSVHYAFILSSLLFFFFKEHAVYRRWCCWWGSLKEKTESVIVISGSSRPPDAELSPERKWYKPFIIINSFVLLAFTHQTCQPQRGRLAWLSYWDELVPGSNESSDYQLDFRAEISANDCLQTDGQRRTDRVIAEQMRSWPR